MRVCFTVDRSFFNVIEPLEKISVVDVLDVDRDVHCLGQRGLQEASLNPELTQHPYEVVPVYQVLLEFYLAELCPHGLLACFIFGDELG